MAEETISTALARAQQAMSHPKKTKTNPHYKSDYADLADVLNAVRPALNEQGIAVVQTVENGELVTELRWKDEAITSRLPLNLDVKPQELGSQLSYLRRYALSAIAGVASEADDDGNAAQTAPARQVPMRDPAELRAEGKSAADSYVLAAANPPDKPLAAMTAGEMARYGESIGVRVSGNKTDIMRTLEPYVKAATGEEPFDVGGDGDAKPSETLGGESNPRPPLAEDERPPFQPVVANGDALRNLPPKVRDSIRRGHE